MVPAIFVISHLDMFYIKSYSKRRVNKRLIMQYGYVLCDSKRSKALVLTKSGDVEYITPDKTENVNKVFCLRDISTMKVLYTSLREKNLIDEMDIVDIQELYGKG